MMNCCSNCFVDTEIQKIISSHAKKGTCDFCCSSNTEIFPIDTTNELSNIISSIVDIYEYCEDGQKLSQALIEDWKIFKQNESTEKLIQSFCIILSSPENPIKPEKKVSLPARVHAENGIFSGHSWDEFSSKIKTENHFHNTYFVPELFSPFLEYGLCSPRKNKSFFRARIARNKQGFSEKDMGAPPIEKSHIGRINPEGIRVLYLADSKETAAREIRAGAFDYVSVGEFKLLKDAKLINLSKLSEISPVIYSGDLEHLAANMHTFSDISKTISKPLRRNDSTLDYLPTQYITEFIKSLGYDGIEYGSTCAPGNNFALFSDEIVKCTQVETLEVTNVNFDWSVCTP